MAITTPATPAASRLNVDGSGTGIVALAKAGAEGRTSVAATPRIEDKRMS